MWVIESLVGRVRQPSQRVRCFFALKMRRYAIGHVKDVAVEGVKVNFDGLNAAVLTLIGRFGGPLLSAQTVNASSALCRCDSSSQTDAHRRRPRMSVSADCAASHDALACFNSRSVRSAAHFWDITAIGSLDDIVVKLRRHGAQVEVIGLNEASATMVERFGTHQKSDARPNAAH
jgi:hypothetical protein